MPKAKWEESSVGVVTRSKTPKNPEVPPQKLQAVPQKNSAAQNSAAHLRKNAPPAPFVSESAGPDAYGNEKWYIGPSSNQSASASTSTTTDAHLSPVHDAVPSFEKNWPSAYAVCPKFSKTWADVQASVKDWPVGFQKHGDFLFIETKICVPTMFLAPNCP